MLWNFDFERFGVLFLFFYLFQSRRKSRLLVGTIDRVNGLWLHFIHLLEKTLTF